MPDSTAKGKRTGVAQRIRSLGRLGYKAAEIAADVQCGESYVYQVLRYSKRTGIDQRIEDLETKIGALSRRLDPIISIFEAFVTLPVSDLEIALRKIRDQHVQANRGVKARQRRGVPDTDTQP